MRVVAAHSCRIVGKVKMPPEMGNRQAEQLDVSARVVTPDIRANPKTLDHDIEAVPGPALIPEDRFRQPDHSHILG